MNVKTPSDMKADLTQLEKAIKDFEAQWARELKGQRKYHLVITGELNKETCNEVAKIYTAAGWKFVGCKTSSDNGERAGLTGLTLEV